MAEYIKREDVIAELSKRSQAENVINAIPAADVVEVVRCCECKHYHAAKDGFGWCENIESPAWDRGVDSDWFCADGKRRGNA